MNIDFNGFNEKVITMQADSTITKPNQWIKVVSNGTACRCYCKCSQRLLRSNGKRRGYG